MYIGNKISLCNFLHSRDHPEATQQMNDLIIAKVSAALKGHWANPDLVCEHVLLTTQYGVKKKKNLI